MYKCEASESKRAYSNRQIGGIIPDRFNPKNCIPSVLKDMIYNVQNENNKAQGKNQLLFRLGRQGIEWVHAGAPDDGVRWED